VTGPFPTFDANTAINFVLLIMLIVIMGAISRTRSLLTAILLMGIYSLVSAVWLTVMDAADVAFTEAVVGAGVSTIVLLGAILLTRSATVKRSWRWMIWPGLAAVAAGALLVYAAVDLPRLGDPASPANAYVGRLYLEAAAHDVGAANVVTAVLSSYRGFDTLGETSVIFAAGLGVAMMLGFGDRAMADNPPAPGRPVPPPNIIDDHVVLRVTAKLLIPMIALYAFYVQFHGDVGPGGGFQAGVILAVAVILFALVFGLEAAMKAIPPRVARGFAAIGVLVYAGVGVLNLVNGGTFLDYDHLFPPGVEAQLPDAAHHHWGQHFGIMAIELGVLMTVSATMITVFYGFAGRSADRPRPSGAQVGGTQVDITPLDATDAGSDAGSGK
jgi:multicomponent Na+:H+ antiporter subunit B